MIRRVRNIEKREELESESGVRRSNLARPNFGRGRDPEFFPHTQSYFDVDDNLAHSSSKQQIAVMGMSTSLLCYDLNE